MEHGEESQYHTPLCINKAVRAYTATEGKTEPQALFLNTKLHSRNSVVDGPGLGNSLLHLALNRLMRGVYHSQPPITIHFPATT